MRVSKSQMAYARAKIAARRAKRIDRIADNLALGVKGIQLGGPGASDDAPGLDIEPPRRPSRPKRAMGKPRAISRGTLKAQIIRLLGLRDRLLHGPFCRIMPECPTKAAHFGTLAYHLVPAQRGDATRFVPENVVWACSAANYGEVMNRSLYREKHITIFGRERMERLEAMAREVRQFKMNELLEMRNNLKKEMETPPCHK